MVRKMKIKKFLGILLASIVLAAGYWFSTLDKETRGITDCP